MHGSLLPQYIPHDPSFQPIGIAVVDPALWRRSALSPLCDRRVVGHGPCRAVGLSQARKLRMQSVSWSCATCSGEQRRSALTMPHSLECNLKRSRAFGFRGLRADKSDLACGSVRGDSVVDDARLRDGTAGVSQGHSTALHRDSRTSDAWSSVPATPPSRAGRTPVYEHEYIQGPGTRGKAH